MFRIHSRRALLTVAALGALLAGCATNPPTSAALTYETEPAGATIFEGGKSLGVAPVTRRYDNGGQPGDITTPDVIAVWPSGAKTSYFTVLKPGDDRVATLQRPASAPNLKADLDQAAKIAAEQKRLKEGVMRDQARASARCQAQLSGTAAVKGGIDDCK